MKYLLLLTMMSAPAQLWAGDWAMRPADRVFTSDELAQLPDQSFVFYDDGESIYGQDGAYSFTFSAANGGGTSWGTYYIAEDGSVCVDFVDGRKRCDLLVHNGARVVLLTENGERYPVR